MAKVKQFIPTEGIWGIFINRKYIVKVSTSTDGTFWAHTKEDRTYCITKEWYQELCGS